MTDAGDVKQIHFVIWTVCDINKYILQYGQMHYTNLRKYILQSREKSVTDGRLWRIGKM